MCMAVIFSFFWFHFSEYAMYYQLGVECRFTEVINEMGDRKLFLCVSAARTFLQATAKDIKAKLFGLVD